jgi:xanthine/uracil permease
VLGGITVVLYGMIGLLGAKIWIENKVDFTSPVNLVPVAAGVVIGVGGVALKFSADFTVAGIALGTIVTLVAYHALRVLAPAHLRAPEPPGRTGPETLTPPSPSAAGEPPDTAAEPPHDPRLPQR